MLLGLMGYLLCLVALAPAAWSATYFVATSGSDSGTGSTRCTRATNVATPVLTINIALGCANPGDTVQVAAGTYTQRVNLNSVANGVGGSVGGGVVTLQGAKAVGAAVTNKTGATIVRGTGLGTNIWLMYGRHLQYFTIKNFELTAMSGGGIGLFGNTTRVTVTDNYVHDNDPTTSALSAIRPTSKYSPTTNTQQGAEIGVTTYVTVARNHVKQWTVGFNQTLPGAGTETLTFAGNNSHFLAEDNLIEGGVFIGLGLSGKTNGWYEDCCNPTIPVTGPSWPHEGVFRGNTVRDMRKGFGAADVGIYCDGCRDVVIERNRVENAPGYCYHSSTEESGFLISRVIIRDNIGINCGTTIINTGPNINTQNPAIHGLSEHLRTVHNTALKTKANGPGWRFGWAPGAVAKNNIVAVSASVTVPYQWTSSQLAANPEVLNGNLFWGSTTATSTPSWQYDNVTYTSFGSYKSGTGQEANGLLADPLFVNLAARDLRLQTTPVPSPAINAGVPLTTAATAGSGTVLRVQDPHYFTDGHDVVNGDVIQVGATLTNIAIVTAVNYATGDLTLDRSLPAWSIGTSVTYPYLGSAPDIGACEGGLPGSRCTTAPPQEIPAIPPAVALELTHTCDTASNSLVARVMGALFYLAPGATYEADVLSRSHCASGVSLTDTASVLAHPASLLPPWHFAGEAGPNVSNSCTNCLSVHGGTPSVNATESGYTLPTFHEGGSVAGATGGASAFTTLPGLCRQVVAGSVTPTPLWPWPMDARIAAARALAGSTPVNVTSTVESVLGPIPLACTALPPRPAGDTTWFIALAGVDGALCTLGAPCATLAHVASRMVSGDTVYFRAGTYAQAIAPGTLPPGTSWSAPTTLAAWQNETVVLQVAAGVVAAFTGPATDRYIALTGLILDGSNAATTQGLVVSNGAGPIRFQAGGIRNTGLERVVVDGGQGVELLTATISGGLTLAALRVQGTTHGFLLQQSTVTTSPAEGVLLVGNQHTQLRLTRNTIRDNAGAGIDLEASGAVIDNTLLALNGLGVWVRAGASGVQLLNTTIADHSGVGVQIDEFALDTALTNTLLWGNATALVNDGEGTVETTTVLTDPGFVGGGDYRPALGASPAVDTGTPLSAFAVALDGTSRPQGAGWDVGAYEQAGTPPVTITVAPRATRGFFDY